MVATLRVGQTVLVHSNPADSAERIPAKFLAGQFGSDGIQWNIQTAGFVTKAPQGIDGIDCAFTGTAVGSTQVVIAGFTPAGIQKQTPFDVVVLPVEPGDLDHFNPVADPPV